MFRNRISAYFAEDRSGDSPQSHVPSGFAVVRLAELPENVRQAVHNHRFIYDQARVRAEVGSLDLEWFTT